MLKIIAVAQARIIDPLAYSDTFADAHPHLARLIGRLAARLTGDQDYLG